MSGGYKPGVPVKVKVWQHGNHRCLTPPEQWGKLPCDFIIERDVVERLGVKTLREMTNKREGETDV